MTQFDPMKIEELPSVLIPLGFTETEALVYGELLRQPDQTGYGLSKTIQKGQPVTYAALAGLESKAAVVASMAPAKVYRAIPPAELIAGLRHAFDRRCALAQERLVHDVVVPSADQLFQLKTRGQVLERARTMLREAESTILYEMFPLPADALRSDLSEAAGRPGIGTVGLVFRPEDKIDKGRMVLSARSEYIRAVWKDEVALLVTDARQVLIASFDKQGEVIRAIWTDSLFFAVLFHNGITADVLLHEKMGKDWAGPNRDLFGKLPPGLFDLTGTAE
jgi:sugar-specific transcriptional regulator TrmB